MSNLQCVQNINSLASASKNIFFSLYRFLQSPFYHVLIILVTLSNACVTASISFKHTPDQKPREHFFQYQKKLEIGFTIFYDLEVFFKIFCFSFNGYIDRTIHKFELILAIMTTIHVLPINGLFLSWISIFQVYTTHSALLHKTLFLQVSKSQSFFPI